MSTVENAKPELSPVMRPVHSGSSSDSSVYQTANVSAPEVTSAATLPGRSISSQLVTLIPLYNNQVFCSDELNGTTIYNIACGGS